MTTKPLLKLFCLYTLLVAQISQASDLGPQAIQWSGFGSVALVKGGNDKLGFRKSLNQDGRFGDWQMKSDSALGGQVDIRLNDNLSATAQAVVRHRLQSSLDNTIEWAFLAYNITPQLTLRGGRMGADLFMFSDFPEVGFAYDWVRPPIEIYGLLPLFRFDGIDLNYAYRHQDNIFNLKLFSGSSGTQVKLANLNNDVAISSLDGIILNYQTDLGQFRAVYSKASVSEFDSQELNNLSQLLKVTPNTEALDVLFKQFDEPVSYYSLGFERSINSWSLISELAYLDSSLPAFLSSSSYYVSLSKHIDNFHIFGMVSSTKNTKKHDPLTPPINAAVETQQLFGYVNQLLLKTRAEQRTFSLGVRWNLLPRLALKLQWDNTQIDRGKTLLWSQQGSDATRLNTFSFSTDFIF